MTNLDRRVLLGIAGIAGAAVASRAATAGSLNPPAGPVAPTGKTTDQIQPRVDLLNAPASANITSDANNQYIINSPGSYYLSANLGVTKAVGISIIADNVTLDLCGFQLGASGTNTFTGIGVDANAAWIGNGSLSGLQYGLLDSSNGNKTGCTLSRLRAMQCSQSGLSPPSASLIEACIVENNGGVGIVASPYSVLNDCIAVSNTSVGIVASSTSILSRCCASKNGGVGISVGGHCTLTDCSADDNGVAALPTAAGIATQEFCVLERCSAGSNYAAYGIIVDYNCVLRHCSSSSNLGSAANSQTGGFQIGDNCLVSACLANDNYSPIAAYTAGVGFSCFSFCRIENCVATGNSGSGILVNGQCAVTGCETDINSFDGITANNNSNSMSANRCVHNVLSGIHVKSGSANVVERNHLLENLTTGVLIESSVCFVHGNLARSNQTNYSIVVGNRVGEIVVLATNTTQISGNVGGVAVTTDPYCNIAF